ncbi:stalk domain-containing protein [Paenibacillus farraposensis]|uniref:Stalk domain-containing protein n=1 Tax=Paenibacillus farraposensis TaxID=2807095 RepID=A0ABW4DCC2_9BACL|nr:stalk domain-containing protein [Paenibacillus farraposensis]MCC3378389.1 copper amine oxidase N-terminal domain-containing protein [Paenibacillus farraposensis]
MKHTQRKIMRKLGVGVAALSLVLSALPAAAADSDKTILELRLQSGSNTAIVNGQKSSITKPYSKSGVLMVPAGVFKKAFNTKIRLAEDNVVKISSGSRIVSLTLGSRIAWVRGHKVALPAPPEMSAGILMVPLRQVAEGLGGKLEKNGAGIVIRMEAQEDAGTEVEETPNIDNDEGKTQIGNSYYEWSMNYPTGLVIGQGGGDESISTFMDENNAYYMEVHVASQPVPLNADDLLQQLVQTAKETGEMVIDRKSFPKVKVPYARVVTKDADGVLWEIRQYYDNGRLYVIYFSDNKATNYKDLSQYAGLLNSFKTSFNAQDKSIKDLSTVVGGTREAGNSDYGVSLSIPAGWKMDDQRMQYESNDGSSFHLKVTSVPADGTLESWSRQLQKWLSDSFVSTAYEAPKTYPMKVAGVQGLVQEYRYNFGDGWVKEYNVLIQQSGYRYLAEYAVPEKANKGSDQFNALISSLQIDFQTVASNFGQLEEDDYLTEKTKTVKKASKAYEYTVNIPRYWTAVSDQFEMADVEYKFTGGRFSIKIDNGQSFEFTVSQLKDFYDKQGKSYKNLKVEEVKDVTFAGVPAVSFTFHRVEEGISYTGHQIVLEHNGKTYTVTTTLNDANNTAVQSNALDSTLNSFMFVK